jgi:glycerol kinase
MADFVLALDQGTSSSRAILFDHDGAPVASAQQPFRQIYPQPGWVEHDPEEIWGSQLATARQALREAKVDAANVAAIGITNQRETTIVWDRDGKPLANAIVWQDRRTHSLCQMLKKRGVESTIRKKTGLFLDPYFSGTKLMWCFDAHTPLRKKARSGSVCFGTIDSWLLYCLTGKMAHATDFTNASRTLLFDIKKRKWDSELCRLFHVPEAVLPETTVEKKK